MAVTPLTHHDIIKRAAPLTRTGLKVNLGASDRSDRYIEFNAQTAHEPSITVIHTLEVDEDGKQLLGRVLVHDSGLVSTLSAVVNDLDSAITVFSQIPLSRQISSHDNYTIANSYWLEPDYQNDQTLAIVQLRFICAYVAGLQLRIDSSTGGGMPADVWLLPQGVSSQYLRETLADGGDIPLDHRAAKSLRLEAMHTSLNKSLPKLPDDLLAVLGPQWRPLRFHGDHWKGVLRQLGNKQNRTVRAEAFIKDAVAHLDDTFATSPEHYHPKHGKARWQVFVRRLQPLMLFIGILALMPISWLFVSSGTMSIHPLALGLTPLLMVGVVVLTAREIPVMELPARPALLRTDAWKPTRLDTTEFNTNPSRMTTGDELP